MKASIWTQYFPDLMPEEKIPLIRQCGFESIELSDEDGKELLSRGGEAAAGAFLKHLDDMEMVQGHLKLPYTPDEDLCGENSAREIEILKRWIALFQALHIKNMILHIGGKHFVGSKEALL